jgi:hypothetical protein
VSITTSKKLETVHDKQLVNQLNYGKAQQENSNKYYRGDHRQDHELLDSNLPRPTELQGNTSKKENETEVEASNFLTEN